MSDGVRLAVGTFTRVPVRPPTSIDRQTAGTAMLLAPLVGLALGLAGCVMLLLADLASAPPMLVAVLTVALLAWLTRALHWDGLADAADGLGSGATRTQALTIMSDPAVGAFGVLGLVLVVLAQVSALTALTAVDTASACLALLTAVITGRLAVSLACLPAVPAARAHGLGATVAGSVQPVAAAIGVLLVGVGLVAVGLVADAAEPWIWLAALVAGLLVGLGTLAVCVRRFGGLTGDVLGAVVEMSTTGALVLATLLLT